MERKPILNAATFRRLKAFSWATDQQLERLSERASLYHIKRRTILFSEGEHSDTLYVLLSGVVKLSVGISGGDYVLVSLIRPGELFGITSLLPGMQRAFQANAFTDCWVCDLQPDTVVETLSGVSIDRFKAFMESTANRWFTLLIRYTHFQVLNVQQKLALTLLELAHKFGVNDARGTIISLQLTHDGLAELVGASRPRVTEYIRELEARQFLLRDGRKFIVDQKRLQKLL